ncbi:Uncharacterised protein [Comamonas testosteroni]|uniref:Uncharacterized protein n=1 Tax=Comamonas testosteroni TaxID=285 RepID=A0A8B4S4F4_COMTE|nr:Uncharacterised protein [Comamonas testosteroni]
MIIFLFNGKINHTGTFFFYDSRNHKVTDPLYFSTQNIFQTFI